MLAPFKSELDDPAPHFTHLNFDDPPKKGGEIWLSPLPNYNSSPRLP